jgi:signal transduction histidine kinase
MLIDQTNREGLRDNLQKGALISILKGLLSDLRTFVNSVDEEVRQQEALDFEALEQRVEGAQANLEKTLEEFLGRHPRERKVANAIRTLSDELKEIMSQAKELAQGLDQRQSQLVHLAGIGLMVEVLAHELNRATQFTLSLLADAELDEAPAAFRHTMDTLESQLKTLQKRLRVLDPMSTAGRQHKERFELVSWIKEILASHGGQFERHDIRANLRVLPANATLPIRAVKGMVVQVIENLVSNSVYWLKRARIDNPQFKPKIVVTIDAAKRTVLFEDNGPGIEPERKDEIFYPFVTTKPAREGKGLGLYIAREIATYSGGRLYLSERPTAHPRSLNTFVFELGPEPNER